MSPTYIPATLRNVLCGKAGKILFDLYRIASLTQDGVFTDHRYRRELHDALTEAIAETLELCATANEKHLTTSDVHLYTHEIMTGGAAGYEFAAYCLDLIEETTRHRAQRELAELLTKIEEFIDLPRAWGRSKICELLEPYGDDQRPLLQKLWPQLMKLRT